MPRGDGAYLIPVQQEAINESPNDTRAGRGLDLLLRCRDIGLAPRGHRVIERNVRLGVHVVVRGVVIRDARDTFDGAQEGAQARPVDCRRRGVPVLSERGVDWQGILGLHRSTKRPNG